MNPLYQDATAHAEWLNARGTKLGSSDCPAILGVSPFKTAADVYVEKVYALEGRTPYRIAEPFDFTNPLQRGHLYEPVIARAYELTTGVTLVSPDATVHPSHDFIAASADRMTSDGRKLVELKKVHWRAADEWGEPGTEQIPDAYLAQVQEQMAVYGVDQCDVVALIGDDDLRIYPIARNKTLCEMILDSMCDFWGRVQRREPPEIDWSGTVTARTLNALRPPQAGQTIDLAEYGETLAAAYKREKQTAKDHAENADAIKCRLIDAMGSAETATAGGFKITRRPQTRAGYTVAPSTFVDVRITATKGKK
jgi:putative phage-type endonuclease